MRALSEYRNYSPSARRAAWLLDRTLGPVLGVAAGTVSALRPGRSETGSRILLVRCDHLGDLLMATPALRALRKTIPGCRVDVLASPAASAALAGNPDVHRVLTLDAPWYEPHRARETDPPSLLSLAGRLLVGGYDTVVEMRGDTRLIALLAASGARRRIGFEGLGLESVLTDRVRQEERRNHLERNFDVLAPLGVRGPATPSDLRPTLAIGERARARAARLLVDAGIGGSDGRGFVVVAPATNRPAHTWGVANFAAVADILRESDLDVVLCARASERHVTAALAAKARHPLVDLAGRTDLQELAALLELAGAVVTNDGGTVHVAAAAGCPVIAIFGPTSPALSFPYEGIGGNRALAGPTKCKRPCFRAGCTDDHGYTSITPSAVAEACFAALDRSPRAHRVTG